MNKNIIILGAGLTGLAAAEILSKKHNVTIIEKQNFLGGLASSYNLNGTLIPKHYHHIFFHDNITRFYLRKFNLHNINFKKIKMAIATNNKVYNFTSPLELLKFNYLSLKARIRYGLFGLYVYSLMNPNKINNNLDAQIWLNRFVGKETTNKLFYHLYAKNKFNIPLNQISAKQFANRLKAKEFLGKFGYPKTTLQSLIDSFEKKIIKNKGIILKKTKIKEIKNKTVKIDKENIKTDIIINTIPIPEFLKVMKSLPKEYRNKLSKIKYCSAVTLLFGTKKFLSEHYWTNVLNERIQVVMQHSILHNNYKDKINWAIRYGGSEQDLKLKEKEITNLYLKDIKKYFPKAEITFTKIFKEKYASPIYDKNYIRNKPNYKTPFPYLYQAGIAVTYPKIRNMNTALESGIKVAKLINETF